MHTIRVPALLLLLNFAAALDTTLAYLHHVSRSLLMHAAGALPSNIRLVRMYMSDHARLFGGGENLTSAWWAVDLESGEKESYEDSDYASAAGHIFMDWNYSKAAHENVVHHRVTELCGGIGWSGGTTCVSGSYIRTACTVLNPYYSQCLPGSNLPSSSSSLPTSSVSSSSIVSQPTGAPSPSTANFWFSFGDSYTQTDFDINGTQPTIGNPLGNPPYPGYTAVGGTNWIDVDTVQYNNSLILTFNYAYGGATINATLVAPYEPTVLSLGDQVNQFLTTAASKPSYAEWTSENALFSFWIGINDIGNSYYEPGDRSAFSDTLLDNYFELVQEIVSALSYPQLRAVGGRNFLFINVPPIDRSPLMLAEAASAQALEKSVIADFNSKLADRVSWFQGNNTGVETWLWDSNAAFTTVLNDPQAYGFVDATSYGNTGDFWGNNYHSSSAAQSIWGQQVGELLGNTVW
ncbi:hypothetical protein NM688_g5554 [Phlebia brevispora]|uniref:Uncharacterized protein n=1 Tax=Phlebia brevispora TaxID=194682 RepID=A0ACC1STI9_9APHY|nr:hypothetical protein NM688_g5554 [Phlebia brevispora]